MTTLVVIFGGAFLAFRAANDMGPMAKDLTGAIDKGKKIIQFAKT